MKEAVRSAMDADSQPAVRAHLYGKEVWRHREGKDLCVSCAKVCKAHADVFAVAAAHGLSVAVTVCENYDGPLEEGIWTLG